MATTIMDIDSINSNQEIETFPYKILIKFLQVIEKLVNSNHISLTDTKESFTENIQLEAEISVDGTIKELFCKFHKDDGSKIIVKREVIIKLRAVEINFFVQQSFKRVLDFLMFKIKYYRDQGDGFQIQELVKNIIQLTKGFSSCQIVNKNELMSNIRNFIQDIIHKLGFKDICNNMEKGCSTNLITHCVQCLAEIPDLNNFITKELIKGLAKFLKYILQHKHKKFKIDCIYFENAVLFLQILYHCILKTKEQELKLQNCDKIIELLKAVSVDAKELLPTFVVFLAKDCLNCIGYKCIT